MSGVNKAIILGNLCKDVETRFLPSGGAVSNITVATSEKWKDKQTGEQKEKAEFHRCVLFGKLAEIAGEYLKKGSKVYLEGALQTRKWTNQQGQDQYTTEIVLQGFNGVMQMLDGKQQAAAPQQPQSQGQQQQRQVPPQRQQAPQQGYQPAQSHNFNNNQQQAPKVNPQAPQGGFNDDIPFAPIGLQHDNSMIYVV